MKIVHLNTYAGGGSFVYASSLDEALREAGHDSTVLLRDLAARPWTDKLLRRGSLAMARGAWHGTHRTLQPPPQEQIEGADVVHLHTVADWFDVPNWVRRLPRSVRVVVGLHDLWQISGGCFVYRDCERFNHHCSPCPMLRSPANRVLASHELKRKAEAYNDANAVFVANSAWLRDLVGESAALRGKQVAVVPPQVDTRYFHPQNREACRASLGLSPDEIVVATGCASLTDANKDTPGLLRILAELNHPNLHVIVFGRGEISAPPGLAVKFLGPQKKEALAEIYGAADIFASASKMETYGLTLAEAYACGCAIVAYQVGGIPEALPRGSAVELCEPGNHASFRDGLRGMIDRAGTGDLPGSLSRAASVAPSPQEAARLLLEIYGGVVE